MDPFIILLLGAGAIAILKESGESANDISFEFKEDKEQKLCNSLIIPFEDSPLVSKDKVKEVIRNYFNNAACPNCGGRRLEGKKITVNYRKLNLYRDIEKKGFFYGTNWEETFVKSVYEVSGIFLKGGGVFSSAGYIKCKSCNWGQNGNSAQMLSFNDLERMVNERLRKYNQ